MNDNRDLDLTRYTTPELRALANQVERRILEVQAAAIGDARARVRAIADSLGIPLEEILRGAAPGRKPRAGRARYVNPDNPQQDWNGLGRKPGWLVALLEKGRALEDLRG